jgi:hypothetical protein
MDIPRLLAKLDEGYDVVSGWRKGRKDAKLTRNFPSWVANRLISTISGVHLHDYGCSLKAYRKSVIKDVKLYGEMHRFIPIYASWQGARVAEIPVTHHARQFGKSKYGLGRTIKVCLDLIVVKFLAKFAENPMYIFGGVGLMSLLVSGVSGAWAMYLKFRYQISFIQTPLPLLFVLTAITGPVTTSTGQRNTVRKRTLSSGMLSSVPTSLASLPVKITTSALTARKVPVSSSNSKRAWTRRGSSSIWLSKPRRRSSPAATSCRPACRRWSKSTWR